MSDITKNVESIFEEPPGHICRPGWKRFYRGVFKPPGEVIGKLSIERTAEEQTGPSIHQAIASMENSTSRLQSAANQIIDRQVKKTIENAIREIEGSIKRCRTAIQGSTGSVGT